MRYFEGWSYEDIASKFEITKLSAQEHVSNAKARVLEVLKQIDNPNRHSLKNKAKNRAKNLQATGKLKKGATYFLLNKIFGFSPTEIAEFYGVNQSGVSTLIGDFARELDELELEIFEFRPKGRHKRKAN